jgi:hypothetical protein
LNSKETTWWTNLWNDNNAFWFIPFPRQHEGENLWIREKQGARKSNWRIDLVTWIPRIARCPWIITEFRKIVQFPRIRIWLSTIEPWMLSPRRLLVGCYNSKGHRPYCKMRSTG